MKFIFNYRDTLFIILGCFFIALIIFLINPIGDTVVPINEDEFEFKKFNMGNSDEELRFDALGNGVFHISPGVKDSVVGEFIFNSSKSLSFYFSLLKTDGLISTDKQSIEFNIYQNENIIAYSIVDNINPFIFHKMVNADEVVKIVVKPGGSAVSEVAKLQINVIREPFAFGQLLSIGIWILFYFYLYRKNFILIFFLYFIIFTIFLLADNLYYGKMLSPSLMSYLILVIAFTFLTVLAYQAIGNWNRTIASIIVLFISIILCIIPGIFIIYYINFDTKLTQDTLFAIFQTNFSEAIEFLRHFLKLKSLLILFPFLTLVIVLIYCQGKMRFQPVELPLGSLFVLLLFFIISRNINDLRIFDFVSDGYNGYTSEISLFKEHQKLRKLEKDTLEATKKGKGETYIVVIGESLNKAHMGLYGYHRDTTPILSELNKKSQLLVFNSAFSNHTHTQPVIRFAFTEANGINKKDFYTSPSIIDVLNSADFETYWVSNQVRFGIYDNVVTVLADSAKSIYYLNKAIGKTIETSEYDDKLIPYIENILSKISNDNRVIFVHLMGNHVSYCSRFPDSYRQYKGELKVSEFGINSQDKFMSDNINCYDNSVKFNDHVVGEIINLLKNNSRGVRGLLYFSDHADDVLNNLGHNSNLFTYSMTQIPMLMWFSEEYKEKYSHVYNNLYKHLNSLFPTELLYDTLIGIFGISTSMRELEYDLSNKNFKIDENKIYVLYGKHKLKMGDNQPYIYDFTRKYNDRSNKIYHQVTNISKLKNENQIGRIIPHRVDSIGKLSQVLYDGYFAFELDLIFREDINGDYFEVGHDEKTRSYMKFYDFLSKLPISDIEIIWLDVKNISEENIHKVKKRLSALDEHYKLKDKIIVETGATSPLVSILSDSGFQTSYYLPTRILVELLKKDEQETLRIKANEIARQVAVQKMRAVSFDLRLYPFVKQYLETLIDDSIVYYTWFPGTNLVDPGFIEKLHGRPYFDDPRVKIILVTYYSDFTL